MTQDLPRRDAVVPELADDDLDEIEWLARDAPLRLVAQTIHSMGGKARSAAIRQKLEGRIGRDFTWKTWWDRVLPAVKESGYFLYRGSQSITLVTRVDNIPDQPWGSLPTPIKASKGTSSSASEWRKWFTSPQTEMPPGRFPTKPAINVLGKFNAKDIGPGLERAAWGAETFLDSGTPTLQPAVGWSEALSRGFNRYKELSNPESSDPLSYRVGYLLTRLYNVAADVNDSPASVRSMSSVHSGKLAESLRSAGAIPGLPLPWRQEFTAGMWLGWRETKYARAFFETSRSHSQMERMQQVALALEIVSSGLREPGKTRRFLEFDRILDRLFPGDRTRLLCELMVGARAGKAPAEGVLDYIGASRHAAKSPSSPDRLDMLVIASLLLADGQHGVADRASHELGETLADGGEERSKVWEGLLTQVQEHIDNLGQKYQDELKACERSFEKRLEENRQREEMLNNQVRRLQHQITVNREEAKMDILQDTVTVITETLQDFRQTHSNPTDTVRHIEARLMLAMRVAGAEEFGTVGETVPYDAVRHWSADHPSKGSPVRISAPGAVMTGKATVDRILIKASVETL